MTCTIVKQKCSVGIGVIFVLLYVPLFGLLEAMTTPPYTDYVTLHSFPCIETDFFLNNQLDSLINPILFCYKTLHVSDIFSTHRQKFSTVYSALVSFMQVSDDHFQAESGWNPDCAWKWSSETCMKLTSAACTVENSWQWAENMPETCRVL